MRKNGVLMHISSLPSDYGIGTLGKEAYKFVDDLKEAGQSIWQLLPVCPTGYGDSPYASYSTFAGNPYFIDLDLLKEDGLLDEKDYKDLKWSEKDDEVDYGLLYKNRFKVLRKAVANFKKKQLADFKKFLEENKFWLEDYALFMALKEANDGAGWLDWKEEYRKYDKKKLAKWKEDYKEDIEFYEIIQYLFFKQWNALLAYANKNGIEIVGDLPIYVALDSVDAWAHPELFALDENGTPKEVAGVPPDGFSATGQLWGNPLYNWDYHKKTGYAWWIKRIEHLTKMYNILRIDHFRGFDSYFAIPYGSTTAADGVWKEGPGYDLFDAMNKKIGEQKIIAEDLGYLTQSVKDLLSKTGYPGMKILEFAFDSRDASGKEYLPYNYSKNSYAYAGTHDNDTIEGWYKAINETDRKFATEYLQLSKENLNWDVIRALLASPSDTTIVQMQDLLDLDSTARMNTPGVAAANWVWRMEKNAFSSKIKETLSNLTELYDRIPARK